MQKPPWILKIIMKRKIYRIKQYEISYKYIRFIQNYKYVLKWSKRRQNTILLKNWKGRVEDDSGQQPADFFIKILICYLFQRPTCKCVSKHEGAPEVGKREEGRMLHIFPYPLFQRCFPKLVPQFPQYQFGVWRWWTFFRSNKDACGTIQKLSLSLVPFTFHRASTHSNPHGPYST